jgi:hypothetical protein
VLICASLAFTSLSFLSHVSPATSGFPTAKSIASDLPFHQLPQPRFSPHSPHQDYIHRRRSWARQPSPSPSLSPCFIFLWSPLFARHE